MNEKPKVTVLMSLYNTPEKQLKSAIESVLNQTYENYDILIINDATQDNGVAIIENYKSNKILIVHNEKNLGLEGALNKGIKLISSKYIIRMDTDDIALPDRIQKQVDFMEQHPEYAFATGRAYYFDENGIYGISKYSGNVKVKDLLWGTPFIHPTMILRKESIEKIGGYPLYRRCEDYAMEFEMYLQGYVGYVMNDILLKYRLDRNGYQKKKYRDRITETKMKMFYFKKLNVKKVKYINAIKPVLIGLIPKKVLKEYHRNKFKDNNGEINEEKIL